MEQPQWASRFGKSVSLLTSPFSLVQELTESPVIAVLFTFAISAHTCWQQFRGSNPFSGRGAIYTIIRLVLEILAFLLWVGTAVLALRPHGGCDDAHRDTVEGIDACFKYSDDRTDNPGWRYTDQPKTTWIVAIACSFVEM